MNIFDLTIEQIKSKHPNATTFSGPNDNSSGLKLNVPPFGKIFIDNYLNITIEYLNPYFTEHKTFESFFKSRLQFDGYSTHIYKDKIMLYKRSSGNLSDFEIAVQRADVFVETAKSIEKFIFWNETLNKKP
jgi:hypothetical protein